MRLFGRPGARLAAPGLMAELSGAVLVAFLGVNYALSYAALLELGFTLGVPRTAMDRLENEHPVVAREFHLMMVRRLSKRLIDRDQLISALAMGRSRGR